MVQVFSRTEGWVDVPSLRFDTITIPFDNAQSRASRMFYRVFDDGNVRFFETPEDSCWFYYRNEAANDDEDVRRKPYSEVLRDFVALPHVQRWKDRVRRIRENPKAYFRAFEEDYQRRVRASRASHLAFSSH